MSENKKFVKIKSFAKVNLSLNVIGRMKNKNHKIESLITFINYYDEIKIRNSNKNHHIIKFNGKFAKGISKNNTIKKLLDILDKKNYLNNKKFEVKIKKNIPHSSGLGGGSMNAATLMQFLFKKKSKKNFEEVASKIGSDVRLGREKKNMILFKNGEIFKTSKKILLHVLVCKPNFGCSTKLIYSGIKKFTRSEYNLKTQNYFGIDKLADYKNDLENVAFNKYSKLSNLKFFFDNLPNLLFSRMTGSGSAIVGYFKYQKDAKNANKLIKKQYKSYWSIISKTI